MASALDGLTVELLKVKSRNVKHTVFDLITELEWITKWLVWWHLSVFVQEQRRKKEFVTTAVESLFWDAVGKVLSRVLLNRLRQNIFPVVIPELYHIDHRLIRCKLKIHFKPQPKKGRASRKTFKADSFQTVKVKGNF